MPSESNPQAGVPQEALSDIERVSNFLSTQEQSEPQDTPEVPPTAEVQPEQPEVQAESEELTAEDVPSEQPEPEQSEADAFEIVHNGQQVKLSREETIKYAMQGFDYHRKTEAVAQKDRFIQQQLEALQQVDQVRPVLQQQEGEVNALAAQLAQYQGVNWVQLANDDPIAYSQHRAKFDLIRDQYNDASQRYQHAYQQVQTRVQQVEQARRAAEIQRLPELVPEWKDQQKRLADEAEIVKHYQTKYGIPPDMLVANLKGAISQAVVYKAMKYDQLLASKAEKKNLLQSKPPVTVPGAKSSTAKQDKDQQLRDRLRKTGDTKDAVALILNRL